MYNDIIKNALAWHSGHGYRIPEAIEVKARALIGNEAGRNGTYGLTTGSQNTGVGAEALGKGSTSALTGDDNTALGFRALEALSGATSYNVAIGSHAGADLTTGAQNIAIGYGTLDRATSGATGNVAIGYAAMHGNFTSADVDNCVAVGKFALGDGTLTANAGGSEGV